MPGTSRSPASRSPGSRVEVRWTSAGGVTKTAATATTDDDGFYQATIAPEATAVWTAAATGPAGETVVSETFRDLTVAPEVSIALANRRAGSGYVEIFSGAVKPAHAGQPGARAAAQRRLLAHGGERLTRRALPLPRLVAAAAALGHLPVPHAAPRARDHEAGVSRTARLRVVLNAGG